MPRKGSGQAGRRTMRAFLIFTACLAVLLTLSPEVHAQAGFDRPGGDLRSFPVRSADPAACAAACERDGKCRAWSFSYPLTAVSGAVCWLKSGVTPRVENNCCISGVRGAAVAEPRNETAEFAIDRQGGDYKETNVASDANGATCKAACEADNKCRAWTYARPGYLAKEARCFLKHEIKPPRRKPCCISGVVR
jgi:PAN domain-containing protein